jgi:peptidoglycan hydrolase-like protein with peptidoglycan-binding domain
MTTTQTWRTSALIALAAVTTMVAVPIAAFAAEKCVFTKDLTIGYEGEEVRCLQKYLNANGYIVAATGVGSTGKETAQYKALTQAAVKQWQLANGIIPSTGTFGAKSRAMYATLTSGSTPTTPSVPVVTPTTPTTPSTSSVEAETRDSLIKAKESLEEIQDDIDEADDDGDDIGDAREYYDEARDELFDALYYFLKREYANSLDSSLTVAKKIRDARDEIRANVDEEDKAREALADAKDAMDEAQDAIDEADHRGKNVSDAEDLLDEAKDAYEEAKDLIRDDEFEDAYDRAQDAEKLAEDAIDEL